MLSSTPTGRRQQQQSGRRRSKRESLPRRRSLQGRSQLTEQLQQKCFPFSVRRRKTFQGIFASKQQGQREPRGWRQQGLRIRTFSATSYLDAAGIGRGRDRSQETSRYI